MWSRSLNVLWICVFWAGFFDKFGIAQWLVDDDGCRTPDRGTGTCMPIRNCQPILEFLKSAQRPITPEVSKKLNAYACGSDGVGIKVCCPEGPISIGATQITPPQIPDVSNHKNFKLLPPDCGLLDSSDRIINGEDASLNEFPWMALLSYNTAKGPAFRCGGTILNKNYILTAAHCVTNLKNQLLGVRVGEHSIKNTTDCERQVGGKLKCNGPVQDLTIEEIIPHPSYGVNSFENDIGLLRVSTINLNDKSTTPVCMPVGDQRKAKFKNGIVTGWGVTGSGVASDILQKVTLPIYNKTECTKVYDSYKIKLNDKQMCAGGINNKDSCPGDSGGPLQIAAYIDGDTRYVQHGIVSFGPKFCGLAGYPGVYTVIAYHMDWVLNSIKP